MTGTLNVFGHLDFAVLEGFPPQLPDAMLLNKEVIPMLYDNQRPAYKFLESIIGYFWVRF